MTPAGSVNPSRQHLIRDPGVISSHRNGVNARALRRVQTLVDREPVAEKQVDSPAAFVPINNKIGTKGHASNAIGVATMANA
jgi:hypothetical protein